MKAEGNCRGPRKLPLERSEQFWGIYWRGTPEQLIEARVVDAKTLMKGLAWKRGDGGTGFHPKLPMLSGRVGEIRREGKYRAVIRELYSEDEQEQLRKSEEARTEEQKRKSADEAMAFSADEAMAFMRDVELARLGRGSPAQLEVGAHVFFWDGREHHEVEIVSTYSVYNVGGSGYRPGYRARRGDRVYFYRAGSFVDKDGDDTHLKLVK